MSASSRTSFAASRLLLPLLLVCSACGQHRAAPQEQEDGGPTSMPGLFALPAPSVLLKRAASAEADIRRAGSAHDAALAPQNAVDNGSALDFTPDYPTHASGLGGLAYALYRFDASGYSDSPTLRCGWASPPEDGTVWIGLARQATDRWIWRSLPASQRLTLPGSTAAPYTAPSGAFLALVVVTGTANPCSLAYVRLGNEPPQTSLIAAPTSGNLPLQVDFDATASSDSDGSVASIELDLGEGAGFAAMPGGLASYSYAAQGSYSATVRVTDNEGAQSETSVQIDAGMLVNQPPLASLVIGTASALPGDVITFDASACSDPDGSISKIEYDPEGDGTYLTNLLNPKPPSRTYIYAVQGIFNPTVRVTDDAGATATASKSLVVSFGTYETRTLDNTAGCGDYCDLGLANGKPCVAYQRGSQLAFVRATTASADNWFSAQLLGNMGLGCSLAIIGSNPAIAYHDGGNTLQYRRANDMDGASWAAPVTAVSGPDSMGVFPALLAVNGRPAVVCSDASAFFSGVTWYARASDPAGGSWGPKHAISGAGQNGAGGSLLLLANGAPCASLVQTSGFKSIALQFCSSLDNLGTDWNPPITLHSGEAYPAGRNALLLSEGKPALAAYDSVSSKVVYLRCKDADGLAWNSPLNVDNAAQSGGYLAAAVINGLPAIAFLDTSRGLCLSLARSSQGGSWAPAIVLDHTATGSVLYIAICELNSRPAIAYSSAGLKFARWK